MECPSFITGAASASFLRGTRASKAAIVRPTFRCVPKTSTGFTMSYDFNGKGYGSLTPRRYRSSAVEKDSRCFKVTYLLPSQVSKLSSRIYYYIGSNIENNENRDLVVIGPNYITS